MKLVVRHGEGELVVPSQKEFLVLYQRGFVGPEDLVRRENAAPDAPWVRADQLPWIRGSALDAKQDGRRLFGLTLVLMVLGLCGVIYIQARAARMAAIKAATPKPKPPSFPFPLIPEQQAAAPAPAGTTPAPAPAGPTPAPGSAQSAPARLAPAPNASPAAPAR